MLPYANLVSRDVATLLEEIMLVCALICMVQCTWMAVVKVPQDHPFLIWAYKGMHYFQRLIVFSRAAKRVPLNIANSLNWPASFKFARKSWRCPKDLFFSMLYSITCTVVTYFFGEVVGLVFSGDPVVNGSCGSMLNGNVVNLVLCPWWYLTTYISQQFKLFVHLDTNILCWWGCLDIAHVSCTISRNCIAQF